MNPRYFGGFANEPTVEMLGLSEETIERRWRRVRAWLKRELAS